MSTLEVQVRALEHEPVSLDPEGNQAIANMRCTASTTADLADVARVAAAYRSVALAWSQQVRATGLSTPMVFYLWWDGLAGQLRCSAVFGTADRLPFSCALRRVDAPESIVEAFVTNHLPPADTGFVLDVWATAL